MIIKAESRYIRISPKKVRQVADLIRGKDVLAAQDLLLNINKGSRPVLLKILKAAIANAKVKGLAPEQLYISKMTCNSGPSWKRFKAAAFGRASPILKRTSHVRIELDLKG